MLILYQQYQSFKKNKKRLAKLSYVGFAIVFVCNMMYVQFEPLILNVESDFYKLWVRVAHYMGLTLLYGVTIIAIHKTHILTQLKYGAIARMYLTAFFVAGCL